MSIFYDEKKQETMLNFVRHPSFTTKVGLDNIMLNEEEYTTHKY